MYMTVFHICVLFFPFTVATPCSPPTSRHVIKFPRKTRRRWGNVPCYSFLEVTGTRVTMVHTCCYSTTKTKMFLSILPFMLWILKLPCQYHKQTCWPWLILFNWLNTKAQIQEIQKHKHKEEAACGLHTQCPLHWTNTKGADVLNLLSIQPPSFILAPPSP